MRKLFFIWCCVVAMGLQGMSDEEKKYIVKFYTDLKEMHDNIKLHCSQCDRQSKIEDEVKHHSAFLTHVCYTCHLEFREIFKATRHYEQEHRLVREE